MLKKFAISKEAVLVPTGLILLIWLVFFIDSFFGFRECYGIIPLHLKGLRGIILAPLFHGGLQHILSNTIPLFVLTFFTFQFYEKLAYFVLVSGWLASGLIVWLLPDFDFFDSSVLSCHIGASGVIYVLAFFLFFSGVFRREKTLMAVSLIVVFLYGGIVWGMFPKEIFGIPEQGAKISWQSHLSGGLIGFVLAYLLRKVGRFKGSVVKPKSESELAYEEELWQNYLQEYYGEENENNTGFVDEINYTYKYKEEEDQDKFSL